MANSFTAADEVIITDIFARVKKMTVRSVPPGVVAASPHPAIRHISGLVDCAEYLKRMVLPNDVVINPRRGRQLSHRRTALGTLQRSTLHGFAEAKAKSNAMPLVNEQVTQAGHWMHQRAAAQLGIAIQSNVHLAPYTTMRWAAQRNISLPSTPQMR